jgi:CheY-like chemotaxis protein
LRFELLNSCWSTTTITLRVLLTEILRAIGVRPVFEANDGAEALAIMRSNPIDIVMTDLAMQPLDGLDFVRKLRNSRESPKPTAPVIMITGHSTQRRVTEARDAGVKEFLSKPVTVRGVLERIARVVESPRAFVRSDDYFGPDRRRRADPSYSGPRRRTADHEIVGAWTEPP